MHWHDAGAWGWGWLLSLVFMLIVFGGLVAVIVAALRRPSGAEPGRAEPPSAGAERILAERFARGELDEEEFEHRRRVLRG
jgi:putative membrane protein